MSATPLIICCVCQSGRFEVQAMMLVASLQGKMPPGTKLVVGYPKPERNFPAADERTTRFLLQFDVEIIEFENEFFSDGQTNRHYQMMLANKLFLLKAFENKAQKVLFLDSDQIAFDALDTFPWWDAKLGVRPVYGWEHVCELRDSQQALYRAAGVAPPLKHVVKVSPVDPNDTIVCTEDVDTSFIAVDGSLVGDFCRKWQEILSISDTVDTDKKYFLEELSCVVAIHALDIPYTEIPRANDHVAHYTWMPALLNNARACAEVRTIVDTYPYIRERAAEVEYSKLIEEAYARREER